MPVECGVRIISKREGKKAREKLMHYFLALNKPASIQSIYSIAKGQYRDIEHGIILNGPKPHYIP